MNMKELGEFELLTSFEPLRCSRTFSKNRKGRELVFTKDQKFFAQFLTSPIGRYEKDVHPFFEP